MTRILAAAAAAAALALGGCASGTQAIADTALALRSGNVVDRAVLDPALRYLRVSVGDRSALLVLGHLDPHPRGTVEVWYSAEREVLRLQNGRVVGAVGVTTEWREVRLPALPDWATVARDRQTRTWTRGRDVMPGYRYGLVDTLRLAAIDAPSDSRLLGLDPRSLAWFEERSDGGPEPLPPARYAVDLRAGGADTVVYGEQCLTPALCLAWQRWPAAVAPAGGRS